jgi:hypothetical protein
VDVEHLDGGELVEHGPRCRRPAKIAARGRQLVKLGQRTAPSDRCTKEVAP